MDDGTFGNQENKNTVISPAIKEFTSNLALLLSEPETIEIFRNGTPEKKLESVLMASDQLLEPKGSFILLNADLPLKNLIKFGQ